MGLNKIVIEGAGTYNYHYPQIAAVITSSATRNDAMTAAWHTSLSAKPPLYGVAVSAHRYTYELILESHSFAVNFLPLERLELVAAIGATKGKEMDKLQALGIAWKAGVKISAPILEDAYSAYECRLIKDYDCGDHRLLAGEIVATHYLEEAFEPAGQLNLQQVQPLLYLGKDNYLHINRPQIIRCERNEAAQKLLHRD